MSHIHRALVEIAGRLVTGESRHSQLACDRTRTLIVDDEEVVAHTFESLIRFALPQLKVDIALNGKEAVKSFCSAHQAILIMDLCMPVMDGLTSFEEIQKLCKAKNWEMPSVVFCTGYAPPAIMNDVIGKNSQHCLVRKPMTFDKMVAVIKSRMKVTAPTKDGKG